MHQVAFKDAFTSSSSSSSFLSVATPFEKGKSLLYLSLLSRANIFLQDFFS